MIDDDRRRLYGRPEPGAEPPALAPLPPPPEPEPVRGGDTEPSPAAPVLEAPAPASRRRRSVIAAVAIIAVGAAVVVAAAAVLLRDADAPSLAVFDREPTEQERDVEENLATQGRLFFPGAEVQARLILEMPDTAQTTAREIWALRSDVSDQMENPYAVVCLATDPLLDSWSTIGCMEEKDVARRGFIPIDQPRPTLLVDGEQRAIAWGPTGDARLIDVPAPPRDDEGS